MKSTNLKMTVIALIMLFYGCGGIMIDEDFEQITTPLTYRQLLGTYIFKPDTLQAKKLRLKSLDAIILKITDDSLKMFPAHAIYVHGSSYVDKQILPASFSGKYYINKMILVTNDSNNKPYSNKWSFFYLKDKVPNGRMGSNSISFEQKATKSYDISYEIGKDPNGVLHIAGYMSDPKYEVIKVIDFKKVK